MKNKKIVIILVIVLIVFTPIALFNNPKNSDIEKIIAEKDFEAGNDVKITGNNSKIEMLAENLDTVWALDFLPNGNIVFTERPGSVNLIDFKNKEKIIIAKIRTAEISESGLAGVAVDPDFAENNFIYLYYTYEDSNEIYNRVSRFILKNNKLSEEKILLDKIPAARFHGGGRIKFGPDNRLYITTGDATVPSTAQDINSIAGKILRMNKDTTIPEGNPFGNYVYSYGHRNPQGIAWDAEKGIMYAAEHGPTRMDEINIIGIGKNYGWPATCDEPSGFEAPIRCYKEFTLAPAGIAYHDNNLYVAGLRGSQVRKIALAEDGKAVLSEEELFSELGRIRDVVVDNNYLYIATSNRDGRGFPERGDDKIIRIKLE